jgi:hypothetical protein
MSELTAIDYFWKEIAKLNITFHLQPLTNVPSKWLIQQAYMKAKEKEKAQLKNSFVQHKKIIVIDADTAFENYYNNYQSINIYE